MGVPDWVRLRMRHGASGKITVGRGTHFGREGVSLDKTADLTIGAGCRITDRVVILTHAHDRVLESDDLDHIRKTPLKIGDRVFIGIGALILGGVGEIGDGAVIAAGAVVNRPVPPRVLVGGTPARVIKQLEGKV